MSKFNMINKFLCLLCFTATIVFTQTIAPEITAEKKRLLILNADESKADDSIDRHVSKIVAEVASSLGRYEVIDRYQLKSILSEQKIQQSGIIAESDIVELGKLASAKEAMKVQINHFSQKGVPPDDEDEDDDDDRGFWEMVVYESVKGAIRMATTPQEEPYAYNMETIIQTDIVLLNIETGELINTFPVSAAHTGGSRGKSLAIALEQIRVKLSYALRNIYRIKSEVLAVDGSRVMLALGSDLGVKRGTVYGVSRLDKKKTFNGREITIPGKSVGLVRVNDISNDGSVGTVIRKWGRIRNGYQAEELIHPPFFGGGFTVRYNNNEQSVDHVNVFLQFNPLNQWGGYVQLGGGIITDSRNDQDALFTLGGGIIFRFLYTPQFNLGGIVDFPMSFVNRGDDFNHSVSAVFIAPQIGLQTEIMINRKLDMIVSGGYSSHGMLGHWTYTKGEGDDAESFDAEWDMRGAPTLDASGFYINFSLRFLNIN